MWSSMKGLSNLNNGLFSVLTSVFLIQLQQKVVMLKIRKFLISVEIELSDTAECRKHSLSE